MKICKAEGCNEPVKQNGYCTKHCFSIEFLSQDDVACKVDGCNLRASRRGYCNRCYQVITYKKENKKRYNKKQASTVNGRESLRKGYKKRRALKRNAVIENFSSKELYERDFYMCCICGLPINPLLKHPDRLSVSLEHKIPLSKGGEHSFNNCAPSHLLCNLRKNNKLIAGNFEGASI